MKVVLCLEHLEEVVRYFISSMNYIQFIFLRVRVCLRVIEKIVGRERTGEPVVDR